MATYQNVQTITLIAGEDLRGDYGEVVRIDASGRVVKTTAANQFAIGVLAGDPAFGDTASTGRPVTVAPFAGNGIQKGKAGAAITRGHWVILDGTSGRLASVAQAAADAATVHRVYGVALENAADGEIFEYLSFPAVHP